MLSDMLMYYEFSEITSPSYMQKAVGACSCKLGLNNATPNYSSANSQCYFDQEKSVRLKKVCLPFILPNLKCTFATMSFVN